MKIQPSVDKPQFKYSLTDVYTWLAIFAIFILLLSRWPLLPNFVDIYYHLSVSDGFNQAGGFVTHDFWDYAPQGRPHLYPPVFHFLLLPLIKIGLPMISIGRICDVIVFPLFLLVIWFFLSSLFNRRLALCAVILSSSLYSLYLSTTNFIPITIALIFGLLSFWTQEKDKIMSSSVFLGFCFYTHAQMPWLFVLTFLIYGLMERDRLFICLRIILFSVLIALPMIVYLFHCLDFHNLRLVREGFVTELNIYLLLSLLGFKTVIKEKGRYSFFLALTLSALPFAFIFFYRYISGQGFLGLIFISSVGLERIWAVGADLLKTAIKEHVAKILVIFAVIFFILFSPSIVVHSKNVRSLFFNSTYVNLVLFGNHIERYNDCSIYSRFIDDIVAIIKQNSEKDDIIYTDAPLIGTMLSVLSGRADAQGMMWEGLPPPQKDPIKNAKLTIWFKNADGTPNKALPEAVKRYGLIKVGETDMAFIYKNNSATAKKAIAQTAIPNKFILAIFLMVSTIIILDLKFTQKKMPCQV